MAIQWDFNNDHMGTVRVEQTFDGKTNSFIIDIYKGNCFAVFVYNFEEKGEKYYNLHSFFMDKEHAKRMLGLDKKYPSTYGENSMDTGIDRYAEFRLDASRKEARELAKLLMDAKWKNPITITMCPDMKTVKEGN